MAFQSIWYFTGLPKEIVDSIEKDLSINFDSQMEDSFVHGTKGLKVVKEKRSSKNAWVPTTHWLGGFLWHYISRANRENFLYDLTCIDGESIQYTQYGIGDYYKWHNDQGLSTLYKPKAIGNIMPEGSGVADDFLNKNVELVRKLSFVLQLSDPDDYEGGNLQLIDETEESYFAPRQRGTIILFDSRTRHRVLPVKSGIRKSIVGWTIGPRWK